MNCISTFRLTLAFIIAISSVGVMKSQFNETISTGRPGQSINPFTTGKGVLQFQQGYIYEKLKLDNDFNAFSPDIKVEANASTFENVIRYGITEKIEINAAINYNWYSIEVQPEMFSDLNEKGNYLSAADIGARIHVVDNHGAVPAIAVQARLGMAQNGDGGEFEIQNVQVTGAFSWQIKDNQGLTINLIPIVAANDELTTQVNYTLAYTMSLTNKFGFFLENYGSLYFNVDSDQFDTYFDGGFSYLINNNVQLDLLGGYGSNRVGVDDNTRINSFFISTGISWRIFTPK